MWLVGWRNLKMLREIADIYGISPGTATQWKLLRKVLHNIAFAGLSEISIHAGSHLLSSSLTASLSARAGQGVGAGLFTARSGLQAIKLCRPLPVDEDNQRQLTSVTQSILGAIKST
jgi:putative membrane protein